MFVEAESLKAAQMVNVENGLISSIVHCQVKWVMWVFQSTNNMVERVDKESPFWKNVTFYLKLAKLSNFLFLLPSTTVDKHLQFDKDNDYMQYNILSYLWYVP